MKRVLTIALIVVCLVRLAVAVPPSEDRESRAFQDELRASERGVPEDEKTPEGLAATRVGEGWDESSNTNPRESGELQVETQVDSTSSLSREDRRKLGLAAGQLLMHVNKARKLLSRDDVSTALEQIDKALVLSRIIESNTPVFSVTSKISSGDLRYDDESTVSAPLIPVCSKLTQAMLLAPIVASRSMRDSSDAKAKEKEHEEREGLLYRMSDVRAFASTAYIDIAYTRVNLEEALRESKKNNAQRAQSLLGTVQKGVLLSYNETDIPVIQARDSLAIARVLARQGKMEDVRRALNASAGALDRYKPQAGQTQSEQVAGVKKEILESAESVWEEDSSLAARIDDWSREISEWIQLG
jgi:hypothetical protein